MSIRNLVNETKPMPINYTSSCYSFQIQVNQRKTIYFL